MVEENRQDYNDFINQLAQDYAIQGNTFEEKLEELAKLGVDAFSLYQFEKEKEEEVLFTPVGMPKEIVVDGKLVNTYDWLFKNTGFKPYVVGDANTFVESLRTENQIKQLQQQLQDAGYLKPGSYILGVADAVTVERFNSLLKDANNAGKKWRPLLNEILANPSYDVSQLPDKPQLDLNVISNEVINTVKKEIGREPTEAEMEILTGILSGYKTEEFEQGKKLLISQAQPSYEEIIFEGRKTGVLRPVDQPEIEVQDSAAKFEAKVRELFKPEMDFNQRREQTRNVANIIKSSVAGLRSIGG